MSNEPTKTQEQPKDPLANIIQPYEDGKTSFAGELEKQQKAEAEGKAKVDSLTTGVQNAIANKASVLGSIVEKRKPKYDENKEKRMRNAAIIQSLGDVLTAAVKGVHAYGKRGAGVVPKGAPSNAMEGVAKINDMQKKYLEQRKAWEGLELSWAQQKADDEIAAAEALLARGEKDYAAAKENREKTEALIRDNEDKIREIKSRNAQNEKDAADGLTTFEEKAKISQKYTKSSGGDGKKTEPNYDLGRILYEFNPQYFDSGVKKSFDALSAGEKKSYEEAAGESSEMALLGELAREGVSEGEALSLLKEFKEKAGADYEDLLEQTIDDYINVYGGTDLRKVIKTSIHTLENYYLR